MAKQNRRKLSAKRKAKLSADYLNKDGRRNKTKSKYRLKYEAGRKGKFSKGSPFRSA